MKGFEPPASGLQNRCSTTELHRLALRSLSRPIKGTTHGLFVEPLLFRAGNRCAPTVRIYHVPGEKVKWDHPMLLRPAYG